MKKFLLLGAAILAVQAVPAIAQDGGHEGKKGGPRGDLMFEEQDANKDGQISQDEYLSFAKARFTETDANKDGNVTKEEAKTHRDAMKAKWKAKREEMKKLKAEKAPEAGKTPEEAPAPKE